MYFLIYLLYSPRCLHKFKERLWKIECLPEFIMTSLLMLITAKLLLAIFPMIAVSLENDERLSLQLFLGKKVTFP